MLWVVKISAVQCCFTVLLVGAGGAGVWGVPGADGDLGWPPATRLHQRSHSLRFLRGQVTREALEINSCPCCPNYLDPDF